LNGTWKEDEIALLLRIKNSAEGVSWAEIAEQIPGRSSEGCRKTYSRLLSNVESNEEIEETETDELDPLDILRDPIDWRRRLEVAEEVQQIRNVDNFTVPIAEITVITDKPFGVWFTADWHLGSVGTDMKLWREHINRFFAIENLRMLLLGDMIANIATHKFRLPVFQQLISPEEQGRVIGSILLQLVQENKLLGVVLTEEHDQRDARDTGVSFLREIVRPMRNHIPFLDNRGQMLLWVGPDKDHLICYVIHCCHKTRYYSFLNALHAPNREARLSIPANVIATAHTHRPAMGVYNWFQETQDVLEFAKSPVILGGEVFCIVCGTYERNAQYGNQQYGPLPVPSIQGLVFDPFKRNIEMARSFEAMEKLLK
jgi:hypothetical protein